MAKVKITGHASGTGVITVTAPNTSTDRTITLPDATGTLLNSDGSAASLTAIPAANITGTLPAINGASLTGLTGSQVDSGQTTAKAWCNHSGSGTTINDSYNVSSVTDNGVGTHTVNLSVTMGNTNYVISGEAMHIVSTGAQQFSLTQFSVVSTTSYGVYTREIDNDSNTMAAADKQTNQLTAVFGD